jgi:hypothetical protein
VAQPPLPLHEFLPLQPLSLALQPPLPLQEFLPWQACFSVSFKVGPASCPATRLVDEIVGLELPDPVGAAFNRAIVPPSKPVKAAVSTKEPVGIFMTFHLLLIANLFDC